MSRARRLAAAGVMAVTLAVSSVSLADNPTPEAPAHVGTPLTVRPSRPLSLAPATPASSGGAWKLVALLGVMGGGAWYWKRRMNGATGTAASPTARSLTVLRRVSIGVRSELMIVEADGQRLLLGVTPQSVSSLAILGDSLAESAAAARDTADEPSNVGDRFAAMLASARSNQRTEALAREPATITPRTAPRRTAANDAAASATDETAASTAPAAARRRGGSRARATSAAGESAPAVVEEQARGLMAAMGGSR